MKVCRRAISILLTINCLFLTLIAPGRADNEPYDGPIIVSLGDSYSSGEGVEPFYEQEQPMEQRQYNQDWLAHRSWESWSGRLFVPGVDGQLRENRNKAWFFVAASGAKIEHLYNSQWKEYDREGVYGKNFLPPQLGILHQLKQQGKKVDYVTLTLGGNDADFVRIIATAATEKDMLMKKGEKRTLNEQLYKVWERFWDEKNGIRKNLHDAYYDIALLTGFDPNTHTGGAHIIVVGYPQLLASQAVFLDGDILFTQNEANTINGNVHSFNEHIRELVEDVCRDEDGLDIEFVSVEGAFTGHEAYSADPYIYPIMVKMQPQDLLDKDGKNYRNWEVKNGMRNADEEVKASSYSMHPNLDGIRAYQECVQQAIFRHYRETHSIPSYTPEPQITPMPGPRKQDEPAPSPPHVAIVEPASTPEPVSTPSPAPTPFADPETALRAYLFDSLVPGNVLSTNPIPCITSSSNESKPGWTSDDLDGMLTASIRDYDGDSIPELLTISVHTEAFDRYGRPAQMTGVVLRMYEAMNSCIILSAEKGIPVNTSFTVTQMLSEQINVLTINHGGDQLIILDDFQASNDKAVSLAAYLYDDMNGFVFQGGVGYYEAGAGSVLLYEANSESGDYTLNCAWAQNGGTAWSEIDGWHDYSPDSDEMILYGQFQDMLYDRYGLNGDDQRLRVNQYFSGFGDDYAGIYNDLMRLTANEVYVDDTDNVQHLACVYNCHYDDYHPVDGASWWLYRYDRTGLLNEFR